MLSFRSMSSSTSRRPRAMEKDEEEDSASAMSPPGAKTNLHGYLSNLSTNWCLTKSSVVRCPFVWAIDNFSFYIGKEESSMVKSSIFSDTTSHPHQWYLNMECRKKPGEPNKDRQVLFTIKMLSLVDQKVKSKIRFSFLDYRGRVLIEKESDEICTFFGANQGWSWNIPHDYLQDIVKDDQFATHDRFIIQCELNILDEYANISSVKQRGKFEIPSASFLEDFTELYHSQRYTDLTITAGGKLYAVHKTVMLTRSPVFAAMFEHETRERVENRIVIDDIKCEVFEQMLHYLYSGKTPDVDQFATDLLIAADKYGLDRLKALCEESIASHLNYENAANVLVIADMYNAAQLKDHTIEFINKHATKVLKTDSWKMLIQHNHAQLISEIFCKMAEKIGPFHKLARKARF